MLWVCFCCVFGFGVFVGFFVCLVGFLWVFCLCFVGTFFGFVYGFCLLFIFVFVGVGLF